MSLAARVLAQGASAEKLEDLLAAAHFYVVSYTAWPNREDLKICVPENHRLKESLTSVFSNRVTAQRRLLVSPLSENPEYEKTCDAIILSGDDDDKKILKRVGDRPILTLSSESDVTNEGGMIYLPKGKPPRILLKKVTQSGLRIDSALLAISEIVQ